MSTSNTHVHIAALLSSCLDAAIQAGSVIRDVFQRGANKTFIDKSLSAPDETPKGMSNSNEIDPQTEADLSAQRIIVASLRRKYPTVTIVGEEGELKCEAADSRELSTSLCLESILGSDDSVEKARASLENLAQLETSRIIVWVDPLDGTREFTEGRKDAVTTLVGISVDGEAFAGVVVVPFENKFVWGIKGVGAFGTVSPIYSASNHPLIDRCRLCTSRSHMNDVLRARLKRIGFDREEDMIRVGGAGNKGVLLVTGEANVYSYPREGTKRWDICAVHAILEALGGSLTDMYGRPIRYNAPTVEFKSDGTEDDDAYNQRVLAEFTSSVSNNHGVLATLGVTHSRFVIIEEGPQSVSEDTKM